MTMKGKLPMVDIEYKLNVTCDTGAFGFIEDLAKSAGEDLVYSLALEKGNLFMCVTAFPSMTDKKFATSEDGMRAIFLIDKEEYGWSQSDMVEKLTKMINDQIYYEKDVTDPEEMLAQIDHNVSNFQEPEVIGSIMDKLKDEK